MPLSHGGIRRAGRPYRKTDAHTSTIATNNNAFTTWDENIKGSIEAGKVADFVILSGDFMTVPEDQILQLHPLATYVAGKRVFSAPDAGRF